MNYVSAFRVQQFCRGKPLLSAFAKQTGARRALCRMPYRICLRQIAFVPNAGRRVAAPTIAFHLKVVILSAAKNPFFCGFHKEGHGFLGRKLPRNDEINVNQSTTAVPRWDGGGPGSTHKGHKRPPYADLFPVLCSLIPGQAPASRRRPYGPVPYSVIPSSCSRRSRSRWRILETPCSCMVTPKRTSASSMVPRRWVITMNWVFLQSCRR